jgi:hypothetical protein
MQPLPTATAAAAAAPAPSAAPALAPATTPPTHFFAVNGKRCELADLATLIYVAAKVIARLVTILADDRKREGKNLSAGHAIPIVNDKVQIVINGAIITGSAEVMEQCEAGISILDFAYFGQERLAAQPITLTSMAELEERLSDVSISTE